MKKVSGYIEARLESPLFELFDGGDFVLSSWRDVESGSGDVEVRIFAEDARAEGAAEVLRRAFASIGADGAEIRIADVPDEDWKFSYRRHFKTEPVGRRLVAVPEWERGLAAESEAVAAGRIPLYIDPGLAFGTGRHETTRTCLEFIDAYAIPGGSFLDMGCGSGILAIAAAKLGFSRVAGFDIDGDAVEAARSNAALNGVEADFRQYALGGGAISNDAAIEAAKGIYPDLAQAPRTGPAHPPFPPARFAVANILAPLLVAFADEIAALSEDILVVSGILEEAYPEVAEAFACRGFAEVERKTAGEWATGLLRRTSQATCR